LEPPGFGFVGLHHKSYRSLHLLLSVKKTRTSGLLASLGMPTWFGLGDSRLYTSLLVSLKALVFALVFWLHLEWMDTRSC
jgi:hypothetical protein